VKPALTLLGYGLLILVGTIGLILAAVWGALVYIEVLQEEQE